MTVKELIEQLQRFNPELIVYGEDTISGEMAVFDGVFGIEGRYPYHGNVYLRLEDEE